MINHVPAEINKRFQTVRIFGSMCSARVILPHLLDRAAIMAAQPLGSQLADVLQPVCYHRLWFFGVEFGWDV